MNFIPPPPVNHDPVDIYNRAYAIVEAVARAYNGDTTSTIPAFRNIRVSPMILALASNPNDLPRIGVYRSSISATCEGDYDTANPRFICTMTMTYSVAAVRSDDLVQFQWLSQLLKDINAALWTDAGFTRLFYGVPSWNMRPNYSMILETPIVEMNLQHQYVYRDEYSPVTPDDFLIWHIKRTIQSETGWQVVHEGEYDANTGEPIKSEPSPFVLGKSKLGGPDVLGP